MQINNSPFHISNRKISSVEKIPNDNQFDNKLSKEPIQNDGFSFWKWFRGLVNPLQNLPLVSGIYSSINSDDSKSDRDLIQNSLGGFMYGGPIGAIAGFGNWLFNKVFDKTPTELALDFTGISNLWKNDKKDKTELVSNKSLESKKNKDEIQDMVSVDSREWWNKNLSNSASKLKIDYNVKEKKFSSSINTEDTKTNLNKNKVALISDKYELSERIEPQKLKNFDIKTNQKIYDITEVSKNKLEHELKPKPDLLNNNKKQFREINFNYPTWKPSDLELGKSSIDSKSKNILNKKYLELENEKQGSNLNMKL